MVDFVVLGDGDSGRGRRHHRAFHRTRAGASPPGIALMSRSATHSGGPAGVHGRRDRRAARGGEPEAQHPALQDHLGDRSEMEPAAGRQSVRRLGGASGPADVHRIAERVARAASGPVRFRGGLSGAGEIGAGGHAGAAGAHFRIQRRVRARIAGFVVLFDQGAHPLLSRGGTESGSRGGGWSVEHSAHISFAAGRVPSQTAGEGLRAGQSAGGLGRQAMAARTLREAGRTAAPRMRDAAGAGRAVSIACAGHRDARVHAWRA